MIRSSRSRSFRSIGIWYTYACNRGRRLLGLPGDAVAAALSLSDRPSALLAGGDAVSVAFEDFLRDPSDDGYRVRATLELFSEAPLEIPGCPSWT